MGFGEDEALNALSLTQNVVEKAVVYLLYPEEYLEELEREKEKKDTSPKSTFSEPEPAPKHKIFHYDILKGWLPKYPATHFLLNMLDYLRFRLPMCHKYCVICDNEHLTESM